MECREFGKFTLLNLMGKGGVGSVYRANDNEAGIVLAIKIFEPSRHRRPGMVRKLRDREVRMLISIQHPNVVKYYDCGEVGDACYYTMEFVEDSLHRHMHDRAELALPDKIHVMRQVCNALQAIHHQGIVHRDIKPPNILLDQAPNGAFHVKVTDLGIAKRVSEMKDDVRKEQKSSRVPGTPKYLSPEQIRLKPVDGRADVFSLGIAAYELLAGDPPFRAKDTNGYLRANLNDEPPAVHRVNEAIPSFMSPVVKKMLAKDRDERYDSDTLARDMELMYQHLISDAPLIESKNPDSVFYVPEVPREAETVKRTWPKPDWRQFFGWPQAAAITLAIGVASAYTLLFWPDMPALPEREAPPQLGVERDLTAHEALEEAEMHMQESFDWLALNLLENIDAGELDSERTERWRTLLEAAHNALAEPFLDNAQAALQAGELPEAQAALQRAKISFPEASGIDELSDELRRTDH